MAGPPEVDAGGTPEMSRPVRLDRLSRGAGLVFREEATPAERAAIAALLDLAELGRLRFSGRIGALGEEGWALDGRLEASAVQRCVVSLRPVPARLRIDVSRRWLAMAGGTEAAIDPEEDDATEPLTARIDLGAIAIEELALALDPYPRHPGAAIDPALAGTGTGDEAGRPLPFAALRTLRGRDDEPG